MVLNFAQSKFFAPWYSWFWFSLGCAMINFFQVLINASCIPSILLHINAWWSLGQCCFKPLHNSEVVLIIKLALILDIFTFFEIWASLSSSPWLHKIAECLHHYACNWEMHSACGTRLHMPAGCHWTMVACVQTPCCQHHHVHVLCPCHYSPQQGSPPGHCWILTDLWPSSLHLHCAFSGANGKCLNPFFDYNQDFTNPTFGMQ